MSGIFFEMSSFQTNQHFTGLQNFVDLEGSGNHGLTPSARLVCLLYFEHSVQPPDERRRREFFTKICLL